MTLQLILGPHVTGFQAIARRLARSDPKGNRISAERHKRNHCKGGYR